MAAPATMEALRWHGAGDLRLEQVPRPTARPGHSVVAVSHCGICGTDLAEFRDGPKMISTRPHPLTGQAPPLTLGHEFSGVVFESGGERAPQPGARVTADACWRCGSCEACVAGDYHLCRYGGSIGLHSDGAFAPWVLVPDYCLIPIPDAVSDRSAALTEPFAVALHGAERGGVGAGTDVVVLGFGPIGAAGALVSRALGAAVQVVELSAERAATAERLGFPLIAPGDGLARRVRAAFGTGGADVVLESTGVAALLPEAIDAAKRGGRIVQLGMGGAPATLAVERLVLFERSLVGSLGYRGDLQKIVKMGGLGMLETDSLVGDTVPLSRAADTIASLAAGVSGSIKVLVEINGP